MATATQRVVTDSMLGLRMPDLDVWSDRVAVVLGQNPGPFTGPGTNTFLVGTGARPLLLDTGQGRPEYLPLLERALDEVRGAKELERIVLTHGHVDHLGGVAGVQERFGPLSVAKKPCAEVDGEVDVLPIDEGAEIEVEGATLRAFWTPGHAQDHLCFYLVEEEALFTGDVVLGAGTTVIPPDGDLGAYLASLRRILALDPRVIYPAHGPVIRNPREKVQSYLDHRALRDQQIVDGLADGVCTVTDLVLRIYADVPPFLHHAAGMSVEAHLRKLEREAVVQRDGAQWSLRSGR
jgi:glyoxylase-like metal-dependent hydrolase (beta-lactamase superfamily II)